jgi:hypothetical protein
MITQILEVDFSVYQLFLVRLVNYRSREWQSYEAKNKVKRCGIYC